MNKEILSNRQGIFVMTMFIIGSAIMVSSSGKAKQDIWIAIILSLLMAMPVIYVYSNLLALYPGKDLFDILTEIFGVVIGKIISLPFIWYSFHLGTLVIRNFSGFVNVISFPETPQAVTVIFLGLFCIWMAKAGIEVLGRWTTFIFPIAMFIIIGTVILSMTNIHVKYFRPILYEGLSPIIESAFGIFSFPFAETVVFTMVFNKLKNTRKSFGVFLKSILLGGAVILIIAVRNVVVLGAPLNSKLVFPSYVAVRTLNIGDFVQRFEVVVAIIFMLGGAVKISICLYAAAVGLTKLLNFDNYRDLTGPVGFLMMSFSCIIYDSLMEMFDWATQIYPYYAIPFQIILPIIVLIAAKIKLKITKKNKKQLQRR